MITKSLMKEFNTLLEKRLDDIQSGKEEDLIKVAHEIFHKEQIMNTLLENENQLSKKDIEFLKSNKHILKKLYKLYQNDYYGEYIDIGLIKTIIKELRK